MFLPILTITAALAFTFAMPTPKDKQKLVFVPIGIGTAISIGMLIELQSRLERGGPFSGMANAMSVATFLYSLTLLWSFITI